MDQQDHEMSEQDMSNSETDIYTELYEFDTNMADVDTESMSSQSVVHPVRTVLGHGLWGPIRLLEEASLKNPIDLLDWCMIQGLINPNSECPTHKRKRTLKHRADRCYFTWHCGQCDEHTPVTSGSIFEGAKLRMDKVLLLCLSFAHGETYEQAKQHSVYNHGDKIISDATIVKYYDMCRDALVSSANELDVNGWTAKIGGPGIVVQIDEAQIGRRKYHVGRLRPDTWVFGMVDSTGEVRMEICENRSKEVLQEIICRNIRQGSIIHSDSWRAHNGLEIHGYTHFTVNHSKEFVAQDGTHTHAIESQWRSLRRMFSPGGRPHEEIDVYLVEHMWRHRCRRDKRDTFPDLIKLLKFSPRWNSN